MDLKYQAKGFLKGELVKQSDRKFAYDGKRLDRIDINLSLSNYRQVKELIEWLEVHKFCLQQINT